MKNAIGSRFWRRSFARRRAYTILDAAPGSLAVCRVKRGQPRLIIVEPGHPLYETLAAQVKRKQPPAR
jgi:hypothetical protein